MKISDLDYYALTGNSLLHKSSVEIKMIWAVALIALIVISNDYLFLLTIYLVMFLYVIFSNLSTKTILLLTFYPLLFVLLMVISTTNITYEFVLLLTSKVLIASTTMILLFATTPYIRLFSKLSLFMPGFLVSAMFLSYRSIFILWTTMENIQQAIYLRGGISFKNVNRSLQVIGNSLGLLLIKSIESSEKMYEGLYLRGHSNKIKYLENKNE
ncbi:MAG: CbiQ family ECF transporter T component [Cyanobacteriota bacterium]